ncbi:malonic semialdehyde reductase [Streptomyces sp. DSM 44917]|uniref:Malonic semialdehyde reductase n=1 Tax=Streptomyces boetiae TaxID=3075541 RepID=A0ABU2L857_9ACTN|nr:malonic semialdehyde reductase [Streptomyces sp. DSM 44917]MDT0307756.1 malonic semialdehyde reductase [Streptomyces sp. DSM 44917]
MSFALDDAALDLLFREAHTARAFTEEPVTDEQVREIYDLIKLAPTAHNTSPLRLTVLRSPAARERLLPHMSQANRPRTAAAPLTVILSLDTDYHEKLPALLPALPDLKDSALYAEPESRFRHGVLNAALQIGYFLLGVRAAGLAAGPMAGFDPQGVDKEFFGEGRLRSLVVVNLGRPAETAYSPRQPRLAFEEAAQVL